MTQSYRGSVKQSLPAAIKIDKGDHLMTTHYQWLTPEAKQKKKKRNKAILYTSFILLSIILSAFVTIIANQM